MSDSYRCMGALVLLLVITMNANSAEPSDRLDFKQIDGVQDVSLIVRAISSRRLFRTNLSLERFDAYLVEPGADYEVRIGAMGSIGEIVNIARKIRLKNPTDLKGADLRYKLEFESGGGTLMTLYIGAFGEIVHEGKVWETEMEPNWLRQVWDAIANDFLK